MMRMMMTMTVVAVIAGGESTVVSLPVSPTVRDVRETHRETHNGPCSRATSLGYLQHSDRPRPRCTKAVWLDAPRSSVSSSSSSSLCRHHHHHHHHCCHCHHCHRYHRCHHDHDHLHHLDDQSHHYRRHRHRCHYNHDHLHLTGQRRDES